MLDLSQFDAAAPNNPAHEYSRNRWNALLRQLEAAIGTGGLSVAASRGMLENVDDDLGASRILAEDGRVGVFKLAAYADHATATDADDSFHGLFLRNNADPAKVWVRQFTGPADIRWFGAVADSSLTGDLGTDCITNFEAAVAVAAAATGVQHDLYRPAMELWLSPGVFRLSRMLNLHATISILAGGTGHPGTMPTWLRLPAESAGIVINRHLSDGYGTLDPANVMPYGDGARIVGVGLFSGNFNGAWGGGASYDDSAEADGILFRARGSVDRCYVQGFQRDNIAVQAGSDGITLGGNANCFRIRDTRTNYAGRHNLFVAGDDANAGSAHRCYFDNARRWGRLDLSALGNSYRDNHAEGNGIGDGVSAIDSIVAYPAAGQRYAVMYGQEVAAATTVPGTNEAIWRKVGGATGGRTWVNGIQVRSGGNYATLNNAGSGRSDEEYGEGGPGPSLLSDSALLVGGTHGNEIIGGGVIYVANGQIKMPRVIDQSIKGTAADLQVISGDTNKAGLVVRQFRNSLMTSGAFFYEQVTLQDFYSLETETSWIYRINGRNPPDNTATRAGRSAPVAHLFKPQVLAVSAYDAPNDGGIISYGSAAPTTGYHAAREIVFNISPSAGGKIGWVCVTAGTPGTWKAFGAIDA